VIMEDHLPPQLRELQNIAINVGIEQIAPLADEVDKTCEWPGPGMQALAKAGLTGLHVPKELGGHGQGLLGLITITEAIGKDCSSTAMCYAMHCVASAVIAAKVTKVQEEQYLQAIAAGQHITTLALSEPGTGIHFFFPQTHARKESSGYVIDGTKHFITNGGHADSYVVSTKASTSAAVGEFSCFIVDKEASGMQWLDPWAGLGMRGNSSRACEFKNVPVPLSNLLGSEGDQIWFVFQVIAPFFLMAMAGVYLGIAQAAVKETIGHLQERRHGHTGEALAEVPLLQYKLAEMWGEVQRTRTLVYHAARLGDLGDEGALPAILMAKASAGDTAVFVTNEAMTRCGGIAYRENAKLARLMRDARASHVMAPTTDILKQWAGRTLLGLPIL
jgi:isovaleryl-CoA dehydrogenase